MTARVDLGLSDDEFFRLTYRQFDMLCQRVHSRRWQEQWQLGAISAAVFNNGMREYKQPFKAEHFMFTRLPGEKSAKPTKTHKKPRMTQKRRDKITYAFRAFAGIRADA